MNNTVYIDSKMSDDARRQAAYAGQIFVHMHSDAVIRFTEYAREMIEAAFAPHDPRIAQHELKSRADRDFGRHHVPFPKALIAAVNDSGVTGFAVTQRRLGPGPVADIVDDRKQQRGVIDFDWRRVNLDIPDLARCQPMFEVEHVVRLTCRCGTRQRHLVRRHGVDGIDLHGAQGLHAMSVEI